MHKKYIVTLTAQERHTLEQLLGKGKVAARKIARAHILLSADAGPQAPAWTDEQIAQTFHVGLATIYRARQAFVEHGLDAALSRRRASRHRRRKLDGEQEAHLIALACGAPPCGCKRWTLRLLAERFVELGHVEAVSPEAIRQTLKKMN
jgi:transposase